MVSILLIGFFVSMGLYLLLVQFFQPRSEGVKLTLFLLLFVVTSAILTWASYRIYALFR